MFKFGSAAALWRRLGSQSGAASSASASDSDEERRLWTRFASQVETTVRLAERPHAPTVTARIRDISQVGICLQVQRAFRIGDLISIQLPSPEGGLSEAALACIVNIVEEPEGGWLLGCTFSQALTDECLAGFGAERRRPPAPDQRAWERFPCDVKATCRYLGAEQEPTWIAQVLDLSATGVGLLVEQPAETGALLNVQLQGPTGHQSPDLLACVVHISARPDGNWLLGCNFIRELKDFELKGLANPH